jgi:hypothetical protein
MGQDRPAEPRSGGTAGGLDDHIGGGLGSAVRSPGRTLVYVSAVVTMLE